MSSGPVGSTLAPLILRWHEGEKKKSNDKDSRGDFYVKQSNTLKHGKEVYVTPLAQCQHKQSKIMNRRKALGRYDSSWSSFYSADMALYKYSSKETTSGGETSQRKTNRRLQIRYSQDVQEGEKKKAQRRNFTSISCWSKLTFFIIYPLCVQKNRSASSYFLLLSSTHQGAQSKKKVSLIHCDCLYFTGSVPPLSYAGQVQVSRI